MLSLQSTGLRWSRFCIASTATAVFASTASVSAFANRQHALQSGESLDALARKYHVSVPDLIRANHIEDQDRIPDGRILTIPTPPRSLVSPPTLHQIAHINKDSVSVRLGPGLEYRRAIFVYEGDQVIVTAQQDGWAQISNEEGKSGWVLQSLLRRKHVHPGDETASNQEGNSSPVPTPHKSVHHAVVADVEDERNRVRKAARHHSSTVASAHKHHAQHQEPEKSIAHSSKHHKQGTRIAKSEEASEPVTHHSKHDAKHHIAAARVSHHKLIAEVAVSSHKRHHKQAASPDNDNNEVTSRVVRRHSKTGTIHKIASSHHKRHIEIADAGSTSDRSDIVRTAYAYRGTPYVYGGERPGGFDCSGFTLHLYGKKGISLPHSARSQFEMGHKVDRNGMKPGDLVFFHTVTPGISHVGMYVGNGKFVHASSRRSGGVRVDNIDSGYYSKAFRGARRIRKSDG